MRVRAKIWYGYMVACPGPHPAVRKRGVPGYTVTVSVLSKFQASCAASETFCRRQGAKRGSWNRSDEAWATPGAVVNAACKPDLRTRVASLGPQFTLGSLFE